MATAMYLGDTAAAQICGCMQTCIYLTTYMLRKAVHDVTRCAFKCVCYHGSYSIVMHMATWAALLEDV